MITQPTIPQVLDSMRAELTDNVLPALDDPVMKVNVEMITALLSALSVRTENEIAWMLEESEGIATAADELVPSLSDAAAVGDALNAYRAAPPASMRLSDVSASYQLASELLSLLSEAAYASADSAAIDRVQGLIDARLAIEQEAIGEFVAVGRT